MNSSDPSILFESMSTDSIWLGFRCGGDIGPPKMASRSLARAGSKVAGGADGAIMPPSTAEAADEAPADPES